MTESKSQLELRVAATVAGEDLACGDFVALLTESVDVPSYLWDGCGVSLSPHEMVRLQLYPDEAGEPLKVFALCLPFVYAKSPGGRTVTIDTRRMQLVRLDRQCAKVVWKKLRPSTKKKR